MFQVEVFFMGRWLPVGGKVATTESAWAAINEWCRAMDCLHQDFFRVTEAKGHARESDSEVSALRDSAAREE